MVRITKIYTRTGDDGTTAIADGSRVSKLDARIVAGGSVDETNSAVGVAVTHLPEGDLKQTLLMIQQQLFDLGADLSQPVTPDDAKLRVTPVCVTWLERQIDAINEPLADLTSFVLPGGAPAAAGLHLARSICRRAERDVLQLAEESAINACTITYLNRLSDLLFVAARQCNGNGAGDVLWEPGRAMPGE